MSNIQADLAKNSKSRAIVFDCIADKHDLGANASRRSEVSEANEPTIN